CTSSSPGRIAAVEQPCDPLPFPACSLPASPPRLEGLPRSADPLPLPSVVHVLPTRSSGDAHLDAVLHLAEALLTSPWLFALVAVLALFGSVRPIVPAEAVLLAAAAYAAPGNPSALLLIGSAWAGALLGDGAAHHLGRGIGPVTRWLRRRKLSGPLVQRAERELRNRGGMLILSARFIPGGRTATNVASGMI